MGHHYFGPNINSRRDGKSALASEAPAITDPEMSLPSCCGCGSLIAPEIRAVQCDRCQKEDRWKCIENVGLRL